MNEVLLHCPRCQPVAVGGGAYRGAATEQRRRAPLEPDEHGQACASCGGLWLEHGALDRLLDVLAKKSGGDAIAGALHRAHARPEERPEASCPACGETLAEREWLRSHIRIEVCLGCRGTWLDPGELEAMVTHWVYLRGW